MRSGPCVRRTVHAMDSTAGIEPAPYALGKRRASCCASCCEWLRLGGLEPPSPGSEPGVLAAERQGTVDGLDGRTRTGVDRFRRSAQSPLCHVEMVSTTGLEPGSFQLRRLARIPYATCSKDWWTLRGSNPHVPACRAGALPLVLKAHMDRRCGVEPHLLALQASASPPSPRREIVGAGDGSRTRVSTLARSNPSH